MIKHILAAIRAHGERDYPREACGLILRVGRKQEYVPCRNLAEDKNHFVLSAEDYAAAEDRGVVLAVVHSHADCPARPSLADKVACEASGLPWYIVEVRDGVAGTMEYLTPCGFKAPLIGRMFHHGVTDCYALVRDVYARELGIELPDFARDPFWWEKGQELYLDNFEKAGFQPVTDGTLKPFDVILMQLLSDRTNHAGVFLGSTPLKEAPALHPVPNAMLHHTVDRLSERVVYGGYWASITRMVVRYAK